MKKKKKKLKKQLLDCYGIQPNGCKIGKITTSVMYPNDGLFRELGDLGKW